MATDTVETETERATLAFTQDAELVDTRSSMFVPPRERLSNAHGDLATPGSSSSVSEHSLIAIRRSTPHWLNDSISTIRRLRNLRPNWDSYGASPINEASIRCAENMLARLSSVETISAPSISASPAGNVFFCWDALDRSLDVEVRPDGTMSFVYLDEVNPLKDKDGVVETVDTLLSLWTQW